MSLKKFSIKDPVEIVTYSFDFSKIITDATETITTGTWSISPRTPGVDSNASAMLVNATNTILGKVCSQNIQNGVDGVEYTVSCVAVTSKLQTIKLSGILPVKVFL